MRKRMRELIRLAEREGLSAVTVTHTGSTHYRLCGTTATGARINIVCSLTPSGACDLHVRGDIRRAIRHLQEVRA
jgi:ABC-type Fe3+/spermidine/putrescine transport system ATPase subunit